ncbi:amidohydrolase family protein [Thermocrispum sp.]|uniref:amidohydrolase family protein n=1 Tax=Thermocrispum sp. TaxID=2060768 RepID=UPI00257C6BC0|nr:amidohydrolase family protein [Thermocrispum sp.]
MTKKILVTGGLVLVGDPRRRDLRRVDVLVENGRISQLTPHGVLSADAHAGNGAGGAAAGAEVIDATDHWVIPGFVDTHTTLWQSTMRALTGDWLLDDYFWCIRMNHMLAYTAADVYASTFGGVVAQLDAGVTTTVDFSHCVNTPEHADAGVEAIIDVGGRAVWCYGFWSPSPQTPAFAFVEERFRDARRIASTYFPSPGGRVTFGVSPTETFRAPYEQIKNEFLVGLETGGLVHPHTNTRWRPGARSDIEVWHEQGILWEHQLHAHCNTSTERDFQLLAEVGAAVSATPETELAMGMGPNILASADRAGVNVGIGADIQANNSPDSLTSMRLAMQTALANATHPVREEPVPAPDGEPTLRPEDVLHFQTLGGARALGLGDVCGSIEVGKAADLVLIDTRTPRLRPVIDPIAAIVLQVSVADIATVLVDGRVAKRNGELDPALSRRAQRLLEESGTRVARAVRERGGWMPPRPHVTIRPNHKGVPGLGEVAEL